MARALLGCPCHSPCSSSLLGPKLLSIRRSVHVIFVPAFGARRFAVFASQDGPPGPSENSDDKSTTESLFMKELKRRRISSTDSSSSSSSNEEANKGARTAGSSKSSPGSTGQRELSQSLSGEGLEGLPARASALIRLGLSFYLSFWPLAAVFAVLFVILYIAFGSDFVHVGQRPSLLAAQQTQRYAPRVIDPYELLRQEEELLPRVPFNP